MADVTKCCSTCKAHKPRGDFHRNRNKPDGLDVRCKSCRHTAYMSGAVKDQPVSVVEKVCRYCCLQKTADLFVRHRRSIDGLASYCKDCYRDRFRGSATRSRLERQYGLTSDAFNALATQQKHRCAICKTPFSDLGKRPSVDHCHTSGRVRGLLCNQCNTGLGFFNDSVESLRHAAEYLTAHGVVNG